MIEGFVQIQKVTSYSVSWRNCWMRIDDKNIHLFYRPNCPPKGVKANKVVPLSKCGSVDFYDECDSNKTGISVQVSQGEPITVQCEDPSLISSFMNVLKDTKSGNTERSSPSASNFASKSVQSPHSYPSVSSPSPKPIQSPKPVHSTQPVKPQSSKPVKATESVKSVPSKQVQSPSPPAIHTPPPKRVTPPSSSPAPSTGSSKMASLLAVFEKSGSQDSRSKSVESTPKPVSSRPVLSSSAPKPAPVQTSKPDPTPSQTSKPTPAPTPTSAPKQTTYQSTPSKPAVAPSKPVPVQSASALKSPSTADTTSGTGTSSSIKKLLEKFTKLEQDEEPRHGLPRRQSIGGVSVKDLAAKHEKTNPFNEAQASARKPAQIGRVKPVLMQEISITTIQEDQELQSDERASEVMKAAVKAGEEKQKSVDDVLSRDSFVKFVDSMCDEILNMDELDLDAIANDTVLSDSAEKQSVQQSVQQPSAPQHVTPPQPIPAQSTLPAQEPISTPQPAPAPKPIPTPQQAVPIPQPSSATELNEDDLGLADLTEDLDFDAIVAEMSRDIAAEESRREEARRSSIQSTGFSLANFKFTPREDTRSIQAGERVYSSHASSPAGITSFELTGILHELCNGVITPKDVSVITEEIQNEQGRISHDKFVQWWTAFISYETPTNETPDNHPMINQEPTNCDQMKDAEPLPECEPQSPQKCDSQLNASRLSCVSSNASWNELWQNLCDEACTSGNEEANYISINASTREYADRIVTETCEMNEKVFRHFLCPDSLKSHLQDGFYEKDGCYFSESGSLFVIPLHTFDPVRLIDEYMATGITEDCDYIAIKASSKEFSQLRYCLDHMGSKSERLCVPASLLLDIAGFRFNIVSALPIYGNHCLYDHTNPRPQLTSRMPSLPNSAMFEVWHGVDNRDYLINSSGLLPRDPLATTQLESTRPLRPEIVDRVVGQSPDEIRHTLMGLAESVTRELEECEDTVCTCAELHAILHTRGMSVRHEGLIYNTTTKMWLKDLIYLDMLGRTAKCILWKNLRCLIYNEKPEIDMNIRHGGNSVDCLNQNYDSLRESIISSVVTFLNYLLSRTPESLSYWSDAYLPSVFSKFSELDSLPAYACNPWELLAAIEYHCGLTLQLSGSERLFEDCYPFTENHVVSLPFRVKLLLPSCVGCDGDRLWDKGHSLLSSPQKSQREQAMLMFQSAIPLLEANHSPLLASAFLHAALAAQRNQQSDQSIELATSTLQTCYPFDSMYMKALGILFYAGQDPLSVITNINDLIATYSDDYASYLPWLVFSVGVLAYPQDPALGMEYVARGVSLGKEILGELHGCVARMQVLVGDILVGVESYEDAIRFYEAAEAILAVNSPGAAADVFMKEALCRMYLNRPNEAINYAMNAYHLKQKLGDEVELQNCIDGCVSIFMSCGRVQDCIPFLETEIGKAMKTNATHLAKTVGRILIEIWSDSIDNEHRTLLREMLQKMKINDSNDEIVMEALSKAPQMMEYLNGLLDVLPNPVSGPSCAKKIACLISYAKGSSFV